MFFFILHFFCLNADDALQLFDGVLTTFCDELIRPVYQDGMLIILVFGFDPQDICTLF
jgi:hypothetical protein